MGNFVLEMKKILTLIMFVTAILGDLCAQNSFFGNIGVPPLREMRAVWLTTIGGLDWPHTYSRTESSRIKQQKELCRTLDDIVAAGFNTVLLQTRIRATTIFQSGMEPWDGCLSGTPGDSPGYDALEFAIDECHKRGLKLHAWIVTIPVGKWNGIGCRSLRKSFPKLIKRIGDEGYMNPEQDGTGDYLASFCKVIAERYDIDGIHLDYIRYPETWGIIRDKEQGRRNITSIVDKINKAVKSVKPWIMMSCSPVGKYADTKRAWSHGWNARDIVCQDAAFWLQKGLMDCLFPMMYFRNENFYPFAIDWKERSNGRIVTPGLGIYFLSPKEKNWDVTDIIREMNVLRSMESGVCFFRTKFFIDNVKGLYDYTKTLYSPYPALQPSMTWYNTPRPTAPSNLVIESCVGDTIMLSWDVVKGDVKQTNGLLYNIYGSRTTPVDVTKAENLLVQNYEGTFIAIPHPGSIRHYAITTTDRYGNESLPVQTEFGKKKVAESSLEFLRLTSDSSNENSNNYNVYLDNCDVQEGQLLVMQSVTGMEIGSYITVGNGVDIHISVPKLATGYYKLYLVNKKGYKHRIGIIDIPVQ